ncbi:MAG: hypothetical protein ACRCWR_00895 [Saezia sp.]
MTKKGKIYQLKQERDATVSNLRARHREHRKMMSDLMAHFIELMPKAGWGKDPVKQPLPLRATLPRLWSDMIGLSDVGVIDVEPIDRPIGFPPHSLAFPANPSIMINLS